MLVEDNGYCYNLFQLVFWTGKSTCLYEKQLYISLLPNLIYLQKRQIAQPLFPEFRKAHAKIQDIELETRK